jgi:hypothetical protein
MQQQGFGELCRSPNKTNTQQVYEKKNICENNYFGNMHILTAFLFSFSICYNRILLLWFTPYEAIMNSLKTDRSKIRLIKRVSIPCVHGYLRCIYRRYLHNANQKEQ